MWKAFWKVPSLFGLAEKAALPLLQAKKK